MSEKTEIRIGQMSDLHLGFRQYGLYDRVRDFYDSAMTAAELLISERPDIVIVPGDIFHHSRPYPIDQRHAFQVFQAFQNAAIPVVATRGNHDASYVWSERQGGNEVHVLQDLDFVKYVEDDFIEISLEGDRQIRVWGLGHHGNEAGERLRDLVERNKDVLDDRSIPNILLAHEYLDNMVATSDLSEYSLNTYGFDYIALGHYHNWWVNGKSTICCTGSTEHVDSSEWNEQQRSVALITISKKLTRWQPSIKRITFDVVPKILKHLNLGSITYHDAVDAVKNVLHELDQEGTIVRIEVTGVLTDTQQGLNISDLAKEVKNAYHVRIIPEFEYEGLPIREDVSDQEVMNEVFNERLGIPKKEVAKWVNLAEGMKEILTGTMDDQGDMTALELLSNFVEAEKVKTGKGGG
jgi:exonuclease SbcD